MGLRFGVWGLGFGVWGLGFGVWGLGFGVWGLGFGVWGLGFGVWETSVSSSNCFRHVAETLAARDARSVGGRLELPHHVWPHALVHLRFVRGSNVIPRRACPGLAGLRPHTF